MKVAFVRTAFIAALEKVAKVVPTAKTVRILNYVLVDAFEGDEHTPAGSLWLSGTDLVSSIRVLLEHGVAVREPGRALLDAQQFMTTLRSFDLPHVTLASVGNDVQCRIGNMTELCKAPPIEQFPEITELEDRFTHTLSRADLIGALRLVRPAAATGAFQPHLEQVGLRAGKVQAADGIRYHEVALPGTEQLDIAFPLPFLDDLVNLFGPAPADTIEIGIPDDRRSIIARLNGTVLTTARKREDFPDVTQAFLFPALANTTTLRLSRRVLAEAVRHVRVMADPATKAIRLQLYGDDFSTGMVSARQPSGAWAEETIPVEWAGTDRTLVFNHEYLTNLLSLFADDALTLRLGEDAKYRPSSVLIQEGGRSGVLMQLRLDWT